MPTQSAFRIDDELPEPEGFSDAQLAEFDAFMGTAVYGDGLSCVETDARTRWADDLLS